MTPYYLNDDESSVRYLIRRVHDHCTGDMWLELWDMIAQRYVTDSNLDGFLNYDQLALIKIRMNEDYYLYDKELKEYLET